MGVADLAEQLTRAAAQAGRPSSDFDLNTGVSLPAGRVLTPAAVLVAVQRETGMLILTKRSARLQHHPGQIAFVGGKQDASDIDATATALREAQEEIGLMPGNVDVLGCLPAHETVTGFQITPVLALVRAAFRPAPEAGEVSEVFEVPLAHVTTPAHFRIESRMWQGGRRYFYTVPYGPYYIWGATARILRALADRMAV